MTIGYLAAVAPGARLVAEASVQKQGRRAGFYEVTVATEAGDPVATVQCVAHRIDVGGSS
jgi:acyl-coenzyme A thioesterase PaaI-like protein